MSETQELGTPLSNNCNSLQYLESRRKSEGESPSGLPRVANKGKALKRIAIVIFGIILVRKLLLQSIIIFMYMYDM